MVFRRWRERVSTGNGVVDNRPVPRALLIAIAAWAVLTSAGILWIWDYKTTPGSASAPPASWPRAVDLPRSGPTLVVTLHPLCPCSEATVSELARLMATLAEPITVYAL